LARVDDVRHTRVVHRRHRRARNQQQQKEGEDGDAHRRTLWRSLGLWHPDPAVDVPHSRYTPHMQRAVLLLFLSLGLLGSTAHAHRCVTTSGRDVSVRGLVAADVELRARPDDGVALDSQRLPIRVHMRISDTNAALDTDAAPVWLAAIEDAWDREVTAQGFTAPLPDDGRGGDDKLDVYLQPLPDAEGAFTVAEDDASSTDGKHASPSFLVVDPALPANLVSIYAVHEFQHACQFAVDTAESPMFMEASAVAQEVLAHPEVHDWWEALAVFQHVPQAPVFASGATFGAYAADDVSLLEYGAALFPLYLDSTYGNGDGTLLRKLWNASVEDDATHTNSPDWLDAAEAVTGHTRAQLVLDFVTWRALVGPFHSDVDGPQMPLPDGATLHAGVLALNAIDGVAHTSVDEEGPFQLGCLVRELHAADGGALSVHVEATSTLAGATLGVAVWTAVPGDGHAQRAVRDVGHTVSTDVVVPPTGVAQVAICDVSPARADDDPAPHAITFTFSLAGTHSDVDAGVIVDAGTAPHPSVTGGVTLHAGGGVDSPSCDDAGSSSNMGDPRVWRSVMGMLGAGVGLFGLFIRGARNRKRKKLYQRRDDDKSPSR
jgi:hypothetical protein